MTILLKHPSTRATFEVDVEDIGVDISNASGVAVPATTPPLVVNGATPNNATSPRQVLLDLSGGVHGVLYTVTLTMNVSSSATPLVSPVTVRCASN